MIFSIQFHERMYKVLMLLQLKLQLALSISGFSSEMIIASNIAKTILEYLKGDITDISPVLAAITSE